jgi:hypothetical protein
MSSDREQPQKQQRAGPRAEESSLSSDREHVCTVSNSACALGSPASMVVSKGCGMHGEPARSGATHGTTASRAELLAAA